MKKTPYNACDYRCERCLETARCAVFKKLEEQERALGTDDPAAVVKALRESFREAEEMIKRKAREFGIDIDEIAGGATADEIREAREAAGRDALYNLAEQFRLEARRFLGGLDPETAAVAAEYVKDIEWHHAMVSAKLFRAIGWKTDAGARDIAADGKNSAAVAVKSLTICIMALDHLASRHPQLAGECTRLSASAGDLKEKIKTRFRLARGA